MKIRIVQQSNTNDKAKNIQKSLDGIAVCKQRRRISSTARAALRIYFCQSEETELFNLAEPIPGESSVLFAETLKTSSCF